MRSIPAWIAPLAVAVIQMIALRAELTITHVDLNDNVSHFTMIERMEQAVERGKNPIDFQVPETSFGYPMLRTYQPLAHAIVVAAYFALGKTVSLATVFAWVRYLSLVLLPFSFYFAGRKLGLRPWMAAAASLLSPLIVTNGLYGNEYGSYVWAGNGLFPQSVATHFLLLAIGLCYDSVREGRRYALSGLMLGLTFLAHFVFGYMGGLTVCLAGLLPNPAAPLRVRMVRVIRIALFAALPAAFQLLSLWQDGPFINHSRWEPRWKWDSFGIGPVFQWLFTGDLLDHGRLPILSVLTLAGLLLLLPRREGAKWKWRAPDPAHLFVAAGALLWMLLYAGRPTWGPLLKIFGISGDVQIHRFISGAQIFLVLLAGIGLGALWEWLHSQWGLAGVALATVALIAPAAMERGKYLANNAEWGYENLTAYHAEEGALAAAIDRVKERGGRVYPGLAASWGGGFKVGYVPMYAFLSVRDVPSVSFLYHSMALTADIMVRFNEANDAQYRLLNIHSAIAGQNALPPFLTEVEQDGRFRVLEAPSGGYFEVIDVPFAAQVDKDSFYDINDRWMQSDLVQKRLHVGLDFGGWFAGVPRIKASDALPPGSWPLSPGDVLSQSDHDETYQATVNAAHPAWVLFRMTYHPNWRVTVDGKEEATAMVSPGFLAVPVTTGKHAIVCQYQPGIFRLVLCIAGLLAVAAAAAWEWRSN